MVRRPGAYPERYGADDSVPATDRRQQLKPSQPFAPAWTTLVTAGPLSVCS